jgi:hypothetical protein
MTTSPAAGFPADRRLLFREVNERIRDTSARLGTKFPALQLICECSRVDCFETIEVPVTVYERLRTTASFLVSAGHEESPLDEAVPGRAPRAARQPRIRLVD